MIADIYIYIYTHLFSLILYLAFFQSCNPTISLISLQGLSFCDRPTAQQRPQRGPDFRWRVQLVGVKCQTHLDVYPSL